MVIRHSVHVVRTVPFLPLRGRNGVVWVTLIVLLAVLSAAGCRRRTAEHGAASIRYSLSRADSLALRLQYIESRDLLRSMLNGEREGMSDSLLAEIYRKLGSSQEELGEFDSALANYRNAAWHFHVAGAQQRESRLSLALPGLTALAGDDRTAQTMVMDLVRTSRLLPNHDLADTALSLAASMSHHLGDYDTEVTLLDELSRTDSAAGRGRAGVQALVREFPALSAAGKDAEARMVYQHALVLATALDDTEGSIAAHIAWAQIQSLSGRPDSALHAYSRALGLLSSQTDSFLRIRTLTGLGCLAYRSRHYDNALMYIADALDAAQRSGNLAAATPLRVLQLAAQWKNSGGAADSAIVGLLAAGDTILNACRRIGYPAGEAFVLLLKGRMSERYGDVARASVSYRDALRTYEHIAASLQAGSIPADCIAVFLDGEHTDWYQPLIDLLATEGNARETFELSEQRNRQQIEQFFLNLTVHTTNQETDRLVAGVQRRERVVVALEQGLSSELSAGRPGSERFEALSGLLPERLDQLIASVGELRAASPNLALVLHADGPLSRSIQDSLRHDAALITWIPAADSLYSIVVTGDTLLLQPIPIAKDQLLTLIRECSRGFSDVNPADRAGSPASILGNVLWTPLAPLLNAVSTLYVVPPKEFGWFPLHTLRIGDSLLIDRFNCHYLPTAAALLFREHPRRPIQTVLAFGFPGKSDWDVEYELRDIRSFIESARMVFSTLATQEYLDTASCDLLHLDAEFIVDSAAPDRSVMRVSDGRTPEGMSDISLGEMMAIPPPAALIFSNVSPLPGMLNRYAMTAFLARGIPTIIITGWQGDRRIRRDFDAAFYAGIQAGIPAPQAYCGAIQALSKAPEYGHSIQCGLYSLYGK